MATYTVAEAEADHEVIIARGHQPVVKLVPVKPAVVKKGKRQFGALKGIIAFDERFCDRLPEEDLRLWNGEGD
jgi:antitoxin (DNA-binding transcriptional repressor) of toxin-antitoxin stability system